MIAARRFEFRQILLVAVVRMHGEVKRGDGKLQFVAILLRGNGNSIFRHLQLDRAGPEGTMRSVRSVTISAFSSLRVIDVLDPFELLQRAVVAMLIFDRLA